MSKAAGIVLGALCALTFLGVSRVEAAPTITLSYSLRAVGGDGVQWVDYTAVSTSGVSSPNFDWAVKQDCGGAVSVSRLYKTGSKTGETYLDAPSGASCSAWVVNLYGATNDTAPQISAAVGFVTP
jgi:hypothetical protein